MKDTSDKKKIIILGSILLVILIALGIAYAYLRTTLEGQKDYVIRAGTLNLILTEDNELTLERQIPIEDSEGAILNGFSFSLTNEGNIDTDYTIYLDDLALDEGESRIPDSAIRYSLTRNDEVIGPKSLTTMGSDPNRRVYFGTIGVDETVNYTLRIWIDYNATKEEAGGKTFKGKLRVVATQPVGEEVSTVLLENIPLENQYDDGVDTFITGTDPNNYIWYSGKLWRAVSVNNEAKTTKLVTQWNMSVIQYNLENQTNFAGSYMESWLNDTTVDGFLGNLREPDKFIVTDAEWDATLDANDLGSIARPNGISVVTDAVGLLNMYEYQSSNNGGTDGYLNNGLSWFTLTPYSMSNIWGVGISGQVGSNDLMNAFGVRPSLNLKSNVRIVDGDGTVDNPYRLEGDNDTDLSGTLLSSRYSGEYIRFGNDENNLYRIVSHETEGLTKITSAESLKDSGTFKTMVFGDNTTFSSSNTIGAFLNGEYLTSYVLEEYSDMIEDNTTWYLGIVENGISYKLAKYKDETGNTLTSSTTTAKVGLLRYGELMTGKFTEYNSIENISSNYWLLTASSMYAMWVVGESGSASFSYSPSNVIGLQPSLNLKSNVIITSGTGTKSDPFILELAS